MDAVVAVYDMDAIMTVVYDMDAMVTVYDTLYTLYTTVTYST